MSSAAKHPMHEKFAEWSAEVTPETYDVQYIRDQAPKKAKGETLRILDIGGGFGQFAHSLAVLLPNAHIDIIDPSELAAKKFKAKGNVSFINDCFIKHSFNEDYDIIIARTLLHHLVGQSERENSDILNNAFAKIKNTLKPNGVFFVTENFYESAVGTDVCGRIIFEITKLKGISPITKRLGANTAGEGVRFRSYHAWLDLLTKAGFTLQDELDRPYYGVDVRWWQKIPLLCKTRYQKVLKLGIPT